MPSLTSYATSLLAASATKLQLGRHLKREKGTEEVEMTPLSKLAVLEEDGFVVVSHEAVEQQCCEGLEERVTRLEKLREGLTGEGYE